MNPIKRNLSQLVIADSSKCTGCKACEVACFTKHNIKKNCVGKTVGTVQVPVTPRLFLTVTENACMPIQCKHCEDAPCLAVCKRNAISRVDNQIIIDESKCIVCKDCLIACSFGAIELFPYYENMKSVYLTEHGREQKIIASKCDLCQGIEGGPACVNICPHEALRLVDIVEETKSKKLKAAETLASLNCNY